MLGFLRINLDLKLVKFEIIRKENSEMLLKKTNIEEKLSQAKTKFGDPDKILDEVYHILYKEDGRGSPGKSYLKTSDQVTSNCFDFDLLETNKIYHISQIKEICIDYRLRFLDVKYFKGNLPLEAISKIKHLEKRHNTVIQGFKIMAPSKLFKLKDKDDPLLFAPIGNKYYYLVHKWGNDLHPLRKLLMWPFKSIINLTFLVLMASYLISLLIPHGLFSKSGSAAQFLIIFFFIFKSIAAVVIFYGVALGKNFNPAIWSNKYLKT